MAINQGYQAVLDQPLTFPEDPEMSYMTVKIEEDVKRPPGVHSLRQWGAMTLAEGKHKNKTFLEVMTLDPEYARWMKKHPKLSSDWATSFQNFVKAWDQTQVGISNVSAAAAPKPAARPKKTEMKEWEHEEEELIFIEEGCQVPVHPLGAKPKAGAQSSKRHLAPGVEEMMEAEVSPEMVSQLRLQVALLQDQLARVTKNTNQ